MNWKRAAGWAAAALLILAVLWFGGVGLWASRRLAEADRQWATTFGSLEDLQKKYPKVETNETAKGVEELAKAAGYDLQEKVAPPDRASQTPVEKARSDARVAIAEWSEAQLRRPDVSLESPPQAARAFLQERSKSLAALEESLLAGPRPEWEFDENRPETGRDFRGWWNYMQLQKALIGRALLAGSEARHAAAQRALEASWILNEGVRKRPDVIAVLLGIAVSQRQVGALRKLDVEGKAWWERLEGLKPRSAMMEALVLSHLQRLKRFQEGGEDLLGGTESKSWGHWVSAFMTRPWNRLGEADYSEALCSELARLRDAPLSDRPSEEPSSGPPRTIREAISFAIPSTRNVFNRADRLVVDAELTAKILEVKELRKKNGGRWPAAAPGIESSKFPGASWRYEVSPDGRMTLSFSRDLESPYPTSRLALPLRFSSN